MIVILNKRILRNMSCKVLEVSKNFNIKALHAEHDSNSKRDDHFDDLSQSTTSIDFINKIHFMQTSHIVTTNRMNYDNDIDLTSKFTNDLLANYFQVNIF